MKERDREKGARVSKGGRFQASKTSISSKYLFSPLILVVRVFKSLDLKA